MDYKSELDRAYAQAKETWGCPPKNKIEFVGNEIFDLTCYDSEVDEMLGSKMLEVIECILNNKTFDYQQTSRQNYINYLIMVNMPFMKDKLNWGTSIRGAFFDEHGHHSDTDKNYYVGFFSFPKSDVKIFMTQLIEWSKQHD